MQAQRRAQLAGLRAPLAAARRQPAAASAAAQLGPPKLVRPRLSRGCRHGACHPVTGLQRLCEREWDRTSLIPRSATAGRVQPPLHSPQRHQRGAFLPARRCATSRLRRKRGAGKRAIWHPALAAKLPLDDRADRDERTRRRHRRRVRQQPRCRRRCRGRSSFSAVRHAVSSLVQSQPRTPAQQPRTSPQPPPPAAPRPPRLRQLWPLRALPHPREPPPPPAASVALLLPPLGLPHPRRRTVKDKGTRSSAGPSFVTTRCSLRRAALPPRRQPARPPPRAA